MHSQVIEILNRNDFVSRALAQNYNVFLPIVDRGIDFILHRESDDAFVKVQLKSRWYIDKKYLNRGISVAFPDRNGWYLVPHDLMVQWGDELGFTATASWRGPGIYHRRPLSEVLQARCQPYFLPPPPNVREEA